MPTTLDQARLEINALFQQALALADSDTPTTLTLVERDLWSLLLAFGRALLTLFLLRQAQRPRANRYHFGGKTWHLAKTRTSEVGTLFGKVVFARQLGRRLGNKRAAADLPIDRELGLLGGFSQGATLLLTKFCAQMSFGLALLNFEEIFQWAPARNTVLRMIDHLGMEAREFMEYAPAPENDGEIIVIQADAKGTPHLHPDELKKRKAPRHHKSGTKRQQRKKARRRQGVSHKEPGRKGHSKNAKMAVVGVIYTLRQTEHGLEGPINKRVIASYEGHDALFKRLQKEALKRGYGVKPSVFLADGSEHIWRCQQKYFAQALCLVDWYHMAEKLWESGRAIYPSKKQEETRRAWVSRQMNWLREGKIDVLVEVLRSELAQTARSGPGNASKRERLAETKRYLETHRERMQYDVFREWGLDIGTGAAEGAVRNVVGLRQDGPGMRWGRGRDELILQLRCVWVNGQWSEFAKFVESREAKKLGAKPIPAIPYKAKAAA